VTGVELVVGWLAAYAWGKARRVAGRADAEVDRALDTGMDRVHDLVSTKLGADPALERLTVEVAQNLETVSVSDRTRQRVQLSLEDAVETDERFAAALDDLVGQLRQAGAPSVTTVSASHTGSAIATDGGIANTGVVMGDTNAGGR
jgi:isopropylmalate/homocitrate/citramalate synthase